VRVPHRRQPAYESLDPEPRALVDRWVAELGREPAETATVFRFLVAMAAAKVGKLREIERLVRDGRPVVILVDPHGERSYQVDDPQLGKAEVPSVDAMLGVLGGC
jgi:hypothetical protein